MTKTVEGLKVTVNERGEIVIDALELADKIENFTVACQAVEEAWMDLPPSVRRAIGRIQIVFLSDPA